MQLYANPPSRQRQIEAAALNELPTLRAAGAVKLDWRSPVAGSPKPFGEFRDGKVLDAVHHSYLRDGWKAYWPQRAQTWDGLAVALDADGQPIGPVLVEAKSYPGELRPKSGRSMAGGERLTLIKQRLAETRAWLGVPERREVVKHWEGDLYQSANRYAVLRFFRDVVGIPAWLLNVYFVDDATHTARSRATSKAAWKPVLRQAEADLGLDGIRVEHAGRAFLPAGRYDELVAATGG
jgi:hypothetical protein